MLILIAESKTMLATEEQISSILPACTTPILEDKAAEIIETLSGLSTAQLSEEAGISSSLASKMQKMIYEFSNKHLGNPAINAYTGVVFKSLDYGSLDAEAANRCDKDVRLISSLYGWLRPRDIIKQYRLDFSSKVAPGGKNLFSFWKKDVTLCLVRELQEKGEHELLNLLPGDAAKCIDWKLVKRFTKVWKADFIEMTGPESSKTPSASKLKTMRGLLLRQILEDGIQNIKTLTGASSDHYVCEGTPVYPDHLQFLC